MNVSASKLPEELKMLTVECLSLLFKNTTAEVRRKIYTPSTHRRLSVVVFHSVQLAKKETFIQLRLAVVVQLVICIMVILFLRFWPECCNLLNDCFFRVAALRLIRVVLQLESDSDEELKKVTAEIAGLMMPGVISCAVSVATSSDTLNHKVVTVSNPNTLSWVTYPRNCVKAQMRKLAKSLGNFSLLEAGHLKQDRMSTRDKPMLNLICLNRTFYLRSGNTFSNYVNYKPAHGLPNLTFNLRTRNTVPNDTKTAESAR